jgi:hypothetical protein
MPNYPTLSLLTSSQRRPPPALSSSTRLAQDKAHFSALLRSFHRHGVVDTATAVHREAPRSSPVGGTGASRAASTWPRPQLERSDAPLFPVAQLGRSNASLLPVAPQRPRPTQGFAWSRPPAAPAATAATAHCRRIYLSYLIGSGLKNRCSPCRFREIALGNLSLDGGRHHGQHRGRPPPASSSSSSLSS